MACSAAVRTNARANLSQWDRADPGSSARRANDDVGAEQLPVLVVYVDNSQDFELFSMPAREPLSGLPHQAWGSQWPEVGAVLVDEAIAEGHWASSERFPLLRSYALDELLLKVYLQPRQTAVTPRNQPRHGGETMTLGQVPSDDFELCPDCGEEQLVRQSPTAQMRICLGCGAVRGLGATSQPTPPTTT
jgi:hypothetical protein